jgi:hypothetical protein
MLGWTVIQFTLFDRPWFFAPAWSELFFKSQQLFQHTALSPTNSLAILKLKVNAGNRRKSNLDSSRSVLAKRRRKAGWRLNITSG